MREKYYEIRKLFVCFCFIVYKEKMLTAKTLLINKVFGSQIKPQLKVEVEDGR